MSIQDRTINAFPQFAESAFCSSSAMANMRKRKKAHKMVDYLEHITIKYFVKSKVSTE